MDSLHSLPVDVGLPFWLISYRGLFPIILLLTTDHVSLTHLIIYSDITLQSNQCYGTYIIRVADVLNRGLAGYNSRWYKTLMPQIMDGIPSDRVSCVVLFMGANDAAHADCPSGQHVPVSEYKQNMIDMIRDLESNYGVNKRKMVLIPAPPYYFDQHIQHCQSINQLPHPKRSMESAKIYSMSCLDVASTLDVATVDIFDQFLSHDLKHELFIDGLHFSESGSRLLFDLISPVIISKVMDFRRGSLDVNFPLWRDFRDEFQLRNPSAEC